MQIIQTGVPFNFTYGAYDQSNGLFIATTIYDITNNTPILVGFIPNVNVGGGVYEGSFTGSLNKNYLTITVAYTNNTYLTVDTTRPPSAECYESINTQSSSFCFNYAAYDLNPNLFVAGSVYNPTTGFIEKVIMNHVANGVYYGAFTGVTQNNSYYVLSYVYTDDTYTTVDSSRTPGNDNYQGIIFNTLDSVYGFINLIGVVDGNAPIYPHQESLTIVNGENRSIAIKIIAANYNPFDISNATDIQVHFRKYDGTALIKSYLTGNFFPGGVTLVNPQQGRFNVALTAEDTAQLITSEQTDFTVYIYFGNFSKGTYAGVSFQAEYPTAKGNVEITFDGQTDLTNTLADFNFSNPQLPAINYLDIGNIPATGTITFTNTNPNPGDTITISNGGPLDDIYEFVSSSPTGHQVLIGLQPYLTQANLLSVLNTNGSSNYSAAINNLMLNQLILIAGTTYPNINGNNITIVSSDISVITTTNFSGGELNITGNEILPNGSLTLTGGSDNTRIVNFYRSLNIRTAVI
jgi:hypothetical protein